MHATGNHTQGAEQQHPCPPPGHSTGSYTGQKLAQAPTSPPFQAHHKGPWPTGRHPGDAVCVRSRKLSSPAPPGLNPRITWGSRQRDNPLWAGTWRLSIGLQGIDLDEVGRQAPAQMVGSSERTLSLFHFFLCPPSLSADTLLLLVLRDCSFMNETKPMSTTTTSHNS